MASKGEKHVKPDRAARKARRNASRLVRVPGPDGLRDDLVLPGHGVFDDAWLDGLALKLALAKSGKVRR